MSELQGPGFTPQKSVDWYNPLQLAQTGIKAVISSIFGNFNDKRELQAALYQNSEQQYFDGYQGKEKGEGGMWIDYISDPGEGFDATYSLAGLLAKPGITFGNRVTKRGDILVMGGDQVYPTAGREEYRNRLKGPFGHAFPEQKNDKNRPLLFAIPGNHDWYDGLTNFLKLFCQERRIGNWQTVQQRSYFAVRLTGKVWLFGIDVQLNSDIDRNQLVYFNSIIEKHFEEDSTIILCTAEPSWVYSTGKREAYNNLKFFETWFANTPPEKSDRQNHPSMKKRRQVLTLAGDLHHYAHYVAEDGTHKITAGGGGAFMHPTQNLPGQIRNVREGVLNRKKIFPSSGESRSLLFRNLWFGIKNWRFSAFIGVFYLLTGWMLYLKVEPGTADAGVRGLLSELLFSPSVCVMLLVLISGMTLFADTKPMSPTFSSSTYRFTGLAHGIFHALLFLFVFWQVAMLNPVDLSREPVHMIVSLATLFAGGFLFAGFLFGAYLILANLLLKNHDNEAYSALRWDGFKNFIRIHVTEEKITVYPVGIPKVNRWTYKKGENGAGAFVTDDTLNPQLIDDPIAIFLTVDK